MVTKTTRTVKPNGQTAKSGHDTILHEDRYRVVYLPIDEINPSPENDAIYGEIEHDEQMDALIESIRRKGLEEPILLTEDGYILSGHRRHFACQYLNFETMPCRIRPGIQREHNTDYHRDLAEYNPQRIKTAGSLLKEALLRTSDAADLRESFEEFEGAWGEVDCDFMAVDGDKTIEEITEKKRPFLQAAQKAVDDLSSFWPLSVRQIHYNLLNNPPLTSTPKRSKFDAEKYRYKNDDTSYNALVRLLRAARYHGHISMKCIDDPTRPQQTFNGFANLGEFLQREIDMFLVGYHRHRQQGQPRHIEVFGEKSTLRNMVQRACQEYYVPWSLGRGFCSTPVWRDMAARFKRSGRERMTLIIVSDYDPEGLELADDAIRTLSQLWRIPVDGHRIAVTYEQVEEYELSEDFNPAKETSSRYKGFVERTGDTRTWEVESLDPQVVVDTIKAAIEANMNMDLFEMVCNEEESELDQLVDIRSQIAGELSFF